MRVFVARHFEIDFLQMSASKKGNEVNEGSSLESITKQLAEMKKKIQLLEGQRKAYYDMWDSEKKKNTEKIKLLKENIKRMYSELSKRINMPKNVKICDKVGSSQEASDEALESLYLKVIEARKKLDLLQHDINQKQQRIVELSTAHSSRTGNRNISKWILPNANTVSSLENQIHQTEINIMEVEHLRKKYKSIKNQLLEESIGFESTLAKLEEKISQQENEISDLQKTYEEAIRFRDTTYETLAKEEKTLAEARQKREMEFENLKVRVESYKMELEKLERHMYPIKVTRADSPSAATENADNEVSQQSAYLERIFNTLKEVSGVIENEDILRRFRSQRETKAVLEKMKTMSEKEKQLLVKQKEAITVEFETHKFTDVKEQECNEDELETLQTEIRKETENYEQVKEEYEGFQNQIKTIMERIHALCIKMKDLDAASVPEKCPSAEKCEWLLKLFRTKVESAIRYNKIITSQRDRKKNADLWSHLPYSTESKVSDIEEEEEIPTRSGLKREAQIIYEARNRKKGYRISHGKLF